ncbi:hypothetical protein EA663_00100 [Pseudoxanthomonas winnipegensis]|nr:hypothetical protein EA663_00100 [Pseudoxanthomonas winnipegensis]
MRRWTWLMLVAAMISGAVGVVATKDRAQSQPPTVEPPAQPPTTQTPSSPERQDSPSIASAGVARSGTLTNKEIRDRQKPVPGKLKDVIDALAPRADAGVLVPQDSERAYAYAYQANLFIG